MISTRSALRGNFSSGSLDNKVEELCESSSHKTHHESDKFDDLKWNAWQLDENLRWAVSAVALWVDINFKPTRAGFHRVHSGFTFSKPDSTWSLCWVFRFAPEKFSISHALANRDMFRLRVWVFNWIVASPRPSGRRECGRAFITSLWMHQTWPDWRFPITSSALEFSSSNWVKLLIHLDSQAQQRKFFRCENDSLSITRRESLHFGEPSRLIIDDTNITQKANENQI